VLTLDPLNALLVAAYLCNKLQSSPVLSRQLHDFSLQSLLCRISGHRLRYHGRLVICGDPRGDSRLWGVATDITVNTGQQLIVKMFHGRVEGHEEIDLKGELFLVESTCWKSAATSILTVHAVSRSETSYQA